VAAVKPVRTVLVDDHPVVLAGLRTELADGFAVVGEAAETTEAIAVIAATRPDVVVCDVNLPGGGGIAVVRACAHLAPIVMVTVSTAERDVLDAVAAGAVGYLDKSTPTDQLRSSLARAAAGEPVFSPALAMLLLDEFRRMARTATGANPLSAREREVLLLVARGYRNREVGAELYISEKTVENHVRNIMGKLHLDHRAQLVRFAVDHGLT